MHLQNSRPQWPAHIAQSILHATTLRPRRPAPGELSRRELARAVAEMVD